MTPPPSHSTANDSPWIRLLYMLLFILIANIVEVIVLVTMIVQFIMMQVSTGNANPRLQKLGRQLGAYIQAIIGFLTYHTDTIPYPFNPWSYGSLGSQDDR